MGRVTLGIMSLGQKSERILVQLNNDLARTDDPARIRHFRIIATPGDLDGWVVLPVVELPGDGDDGWPLEMLDRYADMVAERFRFDEDLLTHCLFRTTEELEDPAHQMGTRVPAA